tara:strand:+ start:1067 stop:1306 length:240 start_codon:yes stop_codon:yes gene_type:complete
MKARLLLLLIFLCLLTVLLTNGVFNLFSSREILFLNKQLTLNSELIISLIALSTLLFVLVVGVIERIFFTKRRNKPKEK